MMDGDEDDEEDDDNDNDDDQDVVDGDDDDANDNDDDDDYDDGECILNVAESPFATAPNVNQRVTSMVFWVFHKSRPIAGIQQGFNRDPTRIHQ